MSAKQAKAQRRADRLVEAITQAHDRLHKDDVDGCHELLHQALDSGRVESDVAPLSHRAGFDEQFRRLCQIHGVRASFVLLDDPETGRLLSGGDAELDAIVTRAFRSAS